VRIVSATNLDEARLFDPGVFRPDLLFRLNTIVIRVPPLRERRDDIPGCCGITCRTTKRSTRGRHASWRPARWNACAPGTWPGNVRALRHACERAVILAEGEYRRFRLGRAGRRAAPRHAGRPRTLQTALTLERSNATPSPPRWRKAKGNISHAARMLGLSRAALYRKLGKHGI
jgi:DNA-binding NtrC family response regulator